MALPVFSDPPLLGHEIISQRSKIIVLRDNVTSRRQRPRNRHAHLACHQRRYFLCPIDKSLSQRPDVAGTLLGRCLSPSRATKGFIGSLNRSVDIHFVADDYGTDLLFRGWIYDISPLRRVCIDELTPDEKRIVVRIVHVSGSLLKNCCVATFVQF